MLPAVLIALLALGLSAFTYLNLERLGRRAWVPLLFRAIAGTALGLLLINLSCPVAGAPQRPLILLDASLSLDAAGARWDAARDSAVQWGEVRTFGDERLTTDSVPTRGRSLLAPALLAASALERPVLVVTDGEIEDWREIPPDILARTSVRVFPRDPKSDVAITQVSGPSRVTAGDSLPIEVLVQPYGTSTPETIILQVSAGATRLVRRTLRLSGESGGRLRVTVPTRALSPGDHILRVSLPAVGDAELRTDTRLHLLTIVPTPGAVLLAGPPDWDSRFLYRTLRDVSQLPVRGYARLEPNRWRSLSDLRPVPADQVRRAARRADLLILKGDVSAMAQGGRARGVWSWPSGESGGNRITGDWYLRAGEASPLADAFLGQPVDSFPPAVQLIPVNPPAGAWVALTAQLGRRGPPRPAVFGYQSGPVRHVVVMLDGLWRWNFRGGSSEQTYRSWAATTASWLLGGRDTAQGVARPLQPVVPNGRPLIFEWSGSGPQAAVGVVWTANDRQLSDTLRFDGSGRALAWLPPGEYRYRLSGGGRGTVAVEQFSEELIPGPVTVSARDARSRPPSGRSSAREWLWLFGLCILALSAEWFARRRLGLR
jgi:hypothetical protein